MTTAVVVGGASGIGAAVAARQRADGLAVVVWDIAGEFDVECDVADPQSIARATAATVEHADDAPSVVTVTAGIGAHGLLAGASADDWDRVFNVNARGVWLAMRALAGIMPATSGSMNGSIVAVSSVSSHLVDRTMGLYCASKAALDMVVRVAAREWAPAVRVNAVAPGVTDTPMLRGAPADGAWLTGVADRTAGGRLGTADDIAAAVVGLHGMHWVTGQILDCDGGLGLFSPINPSG